MKKFDLYVKTIDGVHKQTLLGAFVSVLSAIVVVTLIVSEVKQYSQKDIVNHMTMDSTVGVDAIKLHFDLNFHKISCERLTFLQEVTRGTLHEHGPPTYEKTDIEGGGCRFFGSITTDKVAGNFRFIAEPSKNDESNKVPSTVTGYDMLTPPDISHTINYVVFLSTDPKIGSTDPLQYYKLMNIKYPLQNTVTEVIKGTSSLQS
eukprot:gene3251-6432_t